MRDCTSSLALQCEAVDVIALAASIQAVNPSGRCKSGTACVCVRISAMRAAARVIKVPYLRLPLVQVNVLLLDSCKKRVTGRARTPIFIGSSRCTRVRFPGGTW
jgi:hypothetical protein